MVVVGLPDGVKDDFSKLYEDALKGRTHPTITHLKLKKLATKLNPKKTKEPIQIQGETPEKEALATALLLLMNPQLKPAPTKLSRKELQIIKAIVEANAWEPPTVIQYFAYLTTGMKIVEDKIGAFLVPEDFELTGDYAVLDWGKYVLPGEPFGVSLVGYSERFKGPVVERVVSMEYPDVVRVGQVEVVVGERVFRRTVSVEPLTEVEDLVEGTEGSLRVNAVIDEPVFYFKGVEYWTGDDLRRHASEFLFFGSIRGEFYYYTERAPGVVWRAEGVLSSVRPADGLEAFEVTYVLVGGGGERVIQFYITEDLLNRLAKHPKYKKIIALAKI